MSEVKKFKNDLTGEIVFIHTGNLKNRINELKDKIRLLEYVIENNHNGLSTLRYAGNEIEATAKNVNIFINK